MQVNPVWYNLALGREPAVELVVIVTQEVDHISFRRSYVGIEFL